MWSLLSKNRRSYSGGAWCALLCGYVMHLDSVCETISLAKACMHVYMCNSEPKVSTECREEVRACVNKFVQGFAVG